MIKSFLGLVLGVVIIGGAWYWMNLDSDTSPVLKNSTPPSWENLGTEIKAAFAAQGEPLEERSPFVITEKKDLTGDGILEALINTGSGGAYTSFMAVMRIKDGKPVFIEIKDKDKKTFELSGWPVGASAMHGQDLSLLPEKNALALSGYEVDGRTADIKLAECRSDVYVWNGASEMFEWNSSLTASATEDYCSKAEARLKTN